MLPRFWIADRCLTMTFCSAIRRAPSASVTVVMMGRNSGVRPTASATEKSNDSSALRPRLTLIKRIKSTRKKTVLKIRKPKRFMPRSNSVSSGRAASRVTTSPNGVPGPIATTTAVAVPLTTEVPRKTNDGESGPTDASSSRVAAFSAGNASPVSAACWT